MFNITAVTVHTNDIKKKKLKLLNAQKSLQFNTNIYNCEKRKKKKEKEEKKRREKNKKNRKEKEKKERN